MTNHSKTLCASSAASREIYLLATSTRKTNWLLERPRASAVVVKTSTTPPSMLRTTKRLMARNLASSRMMKMMTTSQSLRSKRKRKKPSDSRSKRRERSRSKHRLSAVLSSLKLRDCALRLRLLRILPAVRLMMRRSVLGRSKRKRSWPACESLKLLDSDLPRKKATPRLRQLLMRKHVVRSLLARMRLTDSNTSRRKLSASVLWKKSVLD